MTRGMTAGLTLTLTAAAAGACFSPAAAQTYDLASPDGRIIVTVEAGEALTWSVTRDDERLLRPSPLSMR
ncbi:MAG: hypothetical protein ACOC5I_03440, partial [Gemmatimonadota bacterium]